MLNLGAQRFSAVVQADKFSEESQSNVGTHPSGPYFIRLLLSVMVCCYDAFLPQGPHRGWIPTESQEPLVQVQSAICTGGTPVTKGMTKTQLVRHLAEKLGTNNKTAAAFIEHLTDTAIKETKKSGVFVVPGLGRLVKTHRKARMGRNPQTGDPVGIKAKTVVKFRVAKAVREDVEPPPDRIIKKIKR